ncbi:hypothetical protein [Roseovarius nubinhibens]|uniref:hypothetical protein n=1 Tax=Roseovarius nubinhibens TaxID=314263 RepID=UPI0030EE302D|tara:strand:+ start:3808 stop:4074 length:267 start_codon:yes stop_codon:yes gene_type:complete
MSKQSPTFELVTDDEIDPRSCRALWCAVLQELFRLAVAPRASDHATETATARRWFGSKDFFMVCSLAGVDGAWVLWGVRRHLEEQGVA